MRLTARSSVSISGCRPRRVVRQGAGPPCLPLQPGAASSIVLMRQDHQEGWTASWARLFRPRSRWDLGTRILAAAQPYAGQLGDLHGPGIDPSDHSNGG